MERTHERNRIIVNGFVRQSQSLLPFEDNPYYNLTEVITQICLVYYALNEYWNLLHHDFVTEENGRRLTRIKGKGRNNTNYGNLTVPSKGNCGYEWHIKINKFRYDRGAIGIVDANESRNYIVKAIGKTPEALSYLYYGGSGDLSYRAFYEKAYGIAYKTGNIIIIKLDTKNGIVQFHHAKNETAEVVLSSSCDIEQRDSLSYQLAATMEWDGTSITLIKFQQYGVSNLNNESLYDDVVE